MAINKRESSSSGKWAEMKEKDLFTLGRKCKD